MIGIVLEGLFATVAQSSLIMLAVAVFAYILSSRAHKRWPGHFVVPVLILLVTLGCLATAIHFSSFSDPATEDILLGGFSTNRAAIDTILGNNEGRISKAFSDSEIFTASAVKLVLTGLALALVSYLVQAGWWEHKQRRG